MFNQATFVGRLVSDPVVETNPTGRILSNITLAVPRAYKNIDGVYETDYIDCTLWSDAAKNTAEYCRKGDLVGIRGRLETNIYEKDGEKKKFMDVIAEKITFLSSRSKEKLQEQSNDEVEEEMDI